MVCVCERERENNPFSPPYLAMSELLFECYEVPALTYGIDGLYNLYHSLGKPHPLSPM